MVIDPKLRQQALDGFHADGIPVSRWALERGLPVQTVYAVLSGRNQGLRGDGHRVAVALGLKPSTRQMTAESMRRQEDT